MLAISFATWLPPGLSGSLTPYETGKKLGSCGRLARTASRRLLCPSDSTLVVRPLKLLVRSCCIIPESRKCVLLDARPVELFEIGCRQRGLKSRRKAVKDSSRVLEPLPNPRQRARLCASLRVSPLTRHPLGVATGYVGLDRMCVKAFVVTVVALAGCGRSDSVVMIKTDHRFSSSDSRTRGVRLPRALKSVDPVVPEGCRKAGVESRFVFEAVVNESGSVESLDLSQPAAISPACPGLEAAVRRALLQSTFEPTSIEGRPARVVLTITERIDAR